MNLGFGLNVNETAQESGYDQYKMNLFESLGAVAKDNWNFNPVMSLLNYSDLYDARKKSQFVNDIKVNRQELNKEYANIGLYFEEDEYQSVVDIMVEKKEAERERQTKKNNIGMSKLTEKQLKSIKKTYETLSNVLCMLGECKDLYLSDLRDLENCFWQLKNNFNLENKE